MALQVGKINNKIEAEEEISTMKQNLKGLCYFVIYKSAINHVCF